MSIRARTRSALSRAAIRSQQRSEGPPRTTRASSSIGHGPTCPTASWSSSRTGSRTPTSTTATASTRSATPAASRWHSMRSCRRSAAAWVAHGSGDADRDVVDAHDRVACPPDRPRYTLRRLWLTHEDHARYYSGFANSALWPLCHVVYVRPRFHLADWQSYCEVNRRFAAAVLEEVEDEPALIFIQDYHLALAARFIKERRPDLQVAMFWHIPWPNPEVFRVLPWKEEILEGMLANDVVGFHIRRHAHELPGHGRGDASRPAWTSSDSPSTAPAGAPGFSRSPSAWTRRRSPRSRRPPETRRAESRPPRAAGPGRAARSASAWTASTTPRASPSASKRSSACSRSTRVAGALRLHPDRRALPHRVA